MVSYVLAARLEEAAFAASRLADAYAAYKRRTGLLLPRLRRNEAAPAIVR